jgi:hypothetical protein
MAAVLEWLDQESDGLAWITQEEDGLEWIGPFDGFFVSQMPVFVDDLGVIDFTDDQGRLTFIDDTFRHPGTA